MCQDRRVPLHAANSFFACHCMPSRSAYVCRLCKRRVDAAADFSEGEPLEVGNGLLDAPFCLWEVEASGWWQPCHSECFGTWAAAQAFLRGYEPREFFEELSPSKSGGATALASRERRSSSIGGSTASAWAESSTPRNRKLLPPLGRRRGRPRRLIL